MSDRLTNFLVTLATDPDKLQQYAQDPNGALDAAGLTAEERAAVLSKDNAMVRSALGQSDADHLTQSAATYEYGSTRGGKKSGSKKGGSKKGGSKKKAAKKSAKRKSSAKKTSRKKR